MRSESNRASGLGRLEADGRDFPLLALFELVAQLLTLLEVAEVRTLYCRDMNEHVLRTVLRLDKAISALNIEPFHCADIHLSFLYREF